MRQTDIYQRIIDVLDPKAAPGVSTPAPGGLSVDELCLAATTVGHMAGRGAPWSATQPDAVAVWWHHRTAVTPHLKKPCAHPQGDRDACWARCGVYHGAAQAHRVPIS